MRTRGVKAVGIPFPLSPRSRYPRAVLSPIMQRGKECGYAPPTVGPTRILPAGTGTPGPESPPSRPRVAPESPPTRPRLPLPPRGRSHSDGGKSVDPAVGLRWRRVAGRGDRDSLARSHARQLHTPSLYLGASFR
jgi:hypothetical protein